MALSQLQCLDDNHVNPRTHESKPEFLYCEDQRLALEALLRDGRDAFLRYLESRGLRGFLSDPELEALRGAVEPYRPDAELLQENAVEEEPPLSLHYWPDLSDTSVPQMDLGWPDSESYRGVTRTTVYSQPPLDGQAHIKEVVRKMIAQALKVIAVVMDVFTDVDIFRDLLDAGFRRKVSVYILLERTMLPHFLSMCQRANMHAGHLKYLRVRYTGGSEFYTRSSTKVRGRMGHRFMFIDGDKAVSGSYSFTWMSSRLDRNFITVVTGQAVDAFDKLFCTLYMTSRSADLQHVIQEPEPEPEPLPQPTLVAPPSATLARKLYNPKYALALGDHSSSPSPTLSDRLNSPKQTESPENTEVLDTKTRKRRRPNKEAMQEALPLHPGLVDLEKACLISYLPTWPEPDPPSDVIGFINIRDSNKPAQVHLQRSEMFEKSQAIRFSSPISVPKEILPEVATPRRVTAKHAENNELQPAPGKTKVKGLWAESVQPPQSNTQPGHIKGKAEAPEQNSPASKPKQETNHDAARALTADDGQQSHPNLDACQNTPTCIITHTLPQSNIKTSTPNEGGPSHMTQSVAINGPQLNSDMKEEVMSSHTQTSARNWTHTSNLSGPSDLNTGQQITTVLPRTRLHTQPRNSSAISLPTLSPSSSTLPIPKPRTIQLLIKEGVTSDGEKPPDFSVIRRHTASTEPQVAHSDAGVAMVLIKNIPENKTETVPEQRDNSGSKGAQKNVDFKGDIFVSPQQNQSQTSQETEAAIGSQDHISGTNLLAETNLHTLQEFFITDATETKSVNAQKSILEKVEPKILSTERNLQSPIATTTQAAINEAESSQTSGEFSKVQNKVTPNKTHPPGDLKGTLCCAVTARDTAALDAAESLQAQSCLSGPATHKPQLSTDGVKAHTSTADTPVQPSDPFSTPVRRMDSLPNTEKHTHLTLTLKARANMHTPEDPLRLHFFDTPAPDVRPPTSETLEPTPDPWTPTSDRSGGYISSRTDSTLSTASDEYYECSGSPPHESILSQAVYHSHLSMEDPVSTKSSDSTQFTGPACINYNSSDVMSVPSDSSSSISESSGFSLSASISSSLREMVKNGEEEKIKNEENGSEVDENKKKPAAAERSVAQGSQGSQRSGSKEAKRLADHLQQDKGLTDSVAKNKGSQLQAPKRKRVRNQPVAERTVDGQKTSDELTNQEAETNQTSTGNPKPDKEKALDRSPLGPKGLEWTRRRSSSTGAEAQKDGAVSLPLLPSRPSHPLSGVHPGRGKVLRSSSQDKASSPRRPPSRPPSPTAAGSSPGQKRAKASNSQQLPRQPLVPQGRVKTGPSTNQHPRPKPQASFLHTHSNLLLQSQPQSHKQTASAHVTHSQEEGKTPSSFSFSRLYNFKTLKDKMNKLPGQSKRDSTSSPVPGQKSPG